ncbi:MAG TPA: M23 family metallopeptidase [Mycobacterium sp.]|nr:M23 family metallopeptidase [Mycobacterium sp.]
MPQHRSFRSSRGVRTNARPVWADFSDVEITDIIPFNEFGSVDDLEFRDYCAFDTEVQVAHAPELDDLHDTDNLTPLRLVVPAEFRAEPRADRREDPHAYRSFDVSEDVTDAPIRRGLHRKPPVNGGAVKGRLLFAAMATGAVAAAAHSALDTADKRPSPTVLAAEESTFGGAAGRSAKGAELITVTPAVDATLSGEELANGVAYAQARAEREARLQRPLYVMPTKGIPTSPFGYRWGVLHGGIDLANSIGTPIVAVADGVVIDAGPAAGFGMWVRLRHNDGTITVYGHVNTINCNIGERVMAGDEIATIGNRGDSTGPHLHFEVWLNGTQRVDPVPWLAQRGINVGGFTG